MMAWRPATHKRSNKLPSEGGIADAPSHVSGTARVYRRTKDLVKRLQPGDVAVISHRDLDVVAAETRICPWCTFFRSSKVSIMP